GVIITTLHVIGGVGDTIALVGGGWSTVGADADTGTADIQPTATFFGWAEFVHTSGAVLLVDQDITVTGAVVV
ncbi:MAG: hypothetical protein ACE1ZY_07450, partial [Alphaproteobacteria bacterium]